MTNDIPQHALIGQLKNDSVMFLKLASEYSDQSDALRIQLTKLKIRKVYFSNQFVTRRTSCAH